MSKCRTAGLETHQKCKLGPEAKTSARTRKTDEQDSPLVQKVAIGINDIGFAEFTLYQGHDVG